MTQITRGRIASHLTTSQVLRDLVSFVQSAASPNDHVYLKQLAREVGFTDDDVSVFRPLQCINTFARGCSSLGGGPVQSEDEQSADR